MISIKWMPNSIVFIVAVNHLQAICCSWLHLHELLRQAQEKDGNSGHKLTGKQLAAIEIHH